MKELKVSDVFHLPIDEHDDHVIFSKFDEYTLTVETPLTTKDEKPVYDLVRRVLNDYDELVKENKRKDKLIMDLADRLNTALCWVPNEDWNNDCDESSVLCGKILDGDK